MFSLVTGMGGPNQVTNAITSGLVFGLFQAGASKVTEKFSSPAADDIYYAKTRSLLISLGFQKYEKNFKKGLLNDQTLPLLTNSALKDVNIPPGPRLLILDQIERDPVLRSGRKRVATGMSFLYAALNNYICGFVHFLSWRFINIVFLILGHQYFIDEYKAQKHLMVSTILMVL